MKALALVAVVALLAVAFWVGGSAPGLQGWQVKAPVPPIEQEDFSRPTPAPQVPTPAPNPAPASTPAPSPAPVTPAPSPTAPQVEPTQSASSTSQTTQPPPPDASTPQPASATLSVSCATVLDNWDWLAPDKQELIPADGLILADTTMELQQGDTPFSLLQRQLRQQRVHMEATYTPGTGDAYIEGIANLYEFDCGQQSGWLYLVNGQSPSRSASAYVLESGDVVQWVFTCNMGADVGAESAR